MLYSRPSFDGMEYRSFIQEAVGSDSQNRIHGRHRTGVDPVNQLRCNDAFIGGRNGRRFYVLDKP